jgi:hypothetical protein
MQMNWNPFKRTSAIELLQNRLSDIDSLRAVWADLLQSQRLLELRVKELESMRVIDPEPKQVGVNESKLLKKLADEKKAHARTYAREYYYRKAANKPLMSEAKRTLNFKKRKSNKEDADKSLG